MQWFSSTLMILQVISSIVIIVLVLLQQGKGADMGAAFGSGSAGSVFGSAGAANFLSRATKWAAILFFVTTGGLAWVAHHPDGSPLDSGLMQGFTSSSSSDSGNRSTSNGAAVPSVGGASVPGEANDNGVVSGHAPAAQPDSAVPTVPSTQDGQSSSVPSVSGGQDSSSEGPAGSGANSAAEDSNDTAGQASGSSDNPSHRQQ